MPAAVGLGLLTASFIGLVTALKAVPAPDVPAALVGVLFLCSFTGFGVTRKSYVSLIYFASFTVELSWAMGCIAPETHSMFVLAAGYVTLDPLAATRVFMLMPLAVGILAAPLVMRALKSYRDLQVPEEESTASVLPRLKKNRRLYRELDIRICRDVDNNKPVVLQGNERFLHMLVLGPTGCGKTSRIFKPQIWQDLDRIKKAMQKGQPMGLTVVEPKGDLADAVAERCEELNIPYIHIDPEKPGSARFNPMQGPADIVAESTRTVLRNIFGRQEAFFAQVQETAARNTILLVKQLKGNNITLLDVLRALRDNAVLENYVNALEARDGRSDITQYFRKEALGRHKDEYSKFAMGLRMQLEDLCGNDLLRQVIIGDGVNLDRHLAEGGVLLVNTAMGRLGKLGDTFGKFLVMHMENAVFRRPGDEWTRPAHFLYIDEFPRYINEDFERFLSIGRSYKCAVILALQSFSQLELNNTPAFRKVIMSNCRNKIVFGGLSKDDALVAEKEMGARKILTRQATYRHKIVMPVFFPETYRTTETEEPRYSYTKIMEVPNFQFLYRMVKNGTLQLPGMGRGELVKRAKAKKPAPQKEEPEFVEEPGFAGENALEETEEIKAPVKTIAKRPLKPIKKF